MRRSVPETYAKRSSHTSSRNESSAGNRKWRCSTECVRPTNTSGSTPPHAFSTALRSAARFDRSQLDWRFAVRTTVGVAIPFVVSVALGAPASGFPSAMGALAAGFASQQGVYVTRAAAMMYTVAAMALSTFVGALAGHSLVVLVLLTALWGYAYGIIASLGPAATTVGINSVIALIVFSHYPAGPEQAVAEA